MKNESIITTSNGPRESAEVSVNEAPTIDIINGADIGANDIDKIGIPDSTTTPGVTQEEPVSLPESAAPEQPIVEPPPVGIILDSAPEKMTRPLCIVGDHAYAASWVCVERGWSSSMDRVIVRDDGQVYVDEQTQGCATTEDLGFKVELSHVPAQDRLWSGAGINKYQAGERPDCLAVFKRVRRVVENFMDFDQSLAAESDMRDLISIYAMGTYFLDAANVVGYLWANGDKGCGKTKMMNVVTEMGFLGQLVLAGGSYATLRDLADYGALIAFDDAENVGTSKANSDKRTLLLAGNRRGARVTVKERSGGNRWRTRYINTFAPRMFSAINIPDEILASRTIMIPLVRSSDQVKANRDPADNESWPEDSRHLRDELWAIGLANLMTMKKYNLKIPERTSLMGRDLEPWRHNLAVALWLEEACGAEGLFGRMNKLALAYQRLRMDLEAPNPTVILIKALLHLADGRNEFISQPSEIATVMNTIAVDDDLDYSGEVFTTPKKVGLLLRRLRFRRAQRTRGSKRWKIIKTQLLSKAAAHGIPVPGQAQPATVAPRNECRGAECAEVQSVCVSPAVLPKASRKVGHRTIATRGRHRRPLLPASRRKRHLGTRFRK